MIEIAQIPISRKVTNTKQSTIIMTIFFIYYVRRLCLKSAIVSLRQKIEIASAIITKFSNFKFYFNAHAYYCAKLKGIECRTSYCRAKTPLQNT